MLRFRCLFGHTTQPFSDNPFVCIRCGSVKDPDDLNAIKALMLDRLRADGLLKPGQEVRNEWRWNQDK